MFHQPQPLFPAADWATNPQRGDVVLFRFPIADGTDQRNAPKRQPYLAVRKAEEKERNDMLRIQDQSIRQLEGRHANLMKAVEDGDYSAPIIAQLNRVDADLAEARARRATEAPEPVELPEDLPAIYRAHIDDLADTLSDEDVSGRASEELQSLIDTVVVDWDGEA